MGVVIDEVVGEVQPGSPPSTQNAQADPGTKSVDWREIQNEFVRRAVRAARLHAD